jgi:hypothetical protein
MSLGEVGLGERGAGGGWGPLQRGGEGHATPFVIGVCGRGRAVLTEGTFDRGPMLGGFRACPCPPTRREVTAWAGSYQNMCSVPRMSARISRSTFDW